MHTARLIPEYSLLYELLCVPFFRASWRAEMRKFIDITGQKFGRLEVKKHVGSDSSGNSLFECLCDCGKTSVVVGTNLRKGRTKSCGCGQGYYTHSGSRTPEYNTWHSMIQRCNNKNSPSFYKYGGKGIFVCESWLKFENFIADIGSAPSVKHTLDRIDGTKGYSKENCRWATYAEQNRNTTRNRNYTFLDKTQCLRDWSTELGIAFSTLAGRFNRGLSVEEAFTGNFEALRKESTGSLNGSSKLQESDIQKIFNLRARGLTQKQIGDQFGVDRVCIGMVLRRETWKHVTLLA